jgi:hypothetical protein
VIRNVRSFAGNTLAIGLLAGVTLTAHNARAHIDLDEAGTHMSRYGGSAIKDGPCGMTGGARGANVYTYKPGATITITIGEYIPHPGYFRIAFDNDGDDGFANPATISGEHGDCNGDPKCGPGMDDFCNNDTVLLDNLDAHVSSGLGTAPQYTWTVTLPNVECTNCTLQIMQVMTDLNYHPADYPADDLYYQCIDLVLSNDAEDTGVSPGENDGIDCKEDEPMGGAGGAGGAGGEGGMGGAGGEGGVTGGTGGMGGAGGMTGGTGGAGGASGASGTGGAGGVTGGTGGMGGTGGSLGTPGGTGGAAGTTMTPGPTSSGEDSGCAASGALQPKHALGTLLPLGLALLLVRRRRNA